METHGPLDTTNLKETYEAKELEPHEKYGVGEAYQFGRTRIELFLGTGEASAVARIHSGKNWFVLADVSEVKPIKGGGLLIDCAMPGQKPYCSISIGKLGEYAILGAPPSSMEVSESGMLRRSGGLEYAQSTIDIEGTPEGVKVQIRGTVDAAPRPVDSKNQRSPLMFFLIEENPKKPEMPVYHEVWAVNKPKQDLKTLKLVKGVLIEAILFRHTYEVELISGGKETVIRHNLVKVIYVENGKRGHFGKRQRREE